MDKIESRIIREPDKTTTIVKEENKESTITQTPEVITIEIK